MTQKKTSFAIHNIEICDPYLEKKGTFHLVIEEGKIKCISQKEADTKNFEGTHIDCTGMTLAPGLCDPHVHFRDPGFAEKETIETGARAAAAGGFTDVACMANTNPVNDNLTTLGYIKYKAQNVDIGIHPICAVTQNLAGKKLVAFETLLKAGAIAFSDDGAIIDNEKILYQALKRVSELDALFIGHCETKSLSENTKVNLGATSFELGIDGNPEFSEGLSVFTHLFLAHQAKARCHIAHVSSSDALEWIKYFREKGSKLSCEVTPHHLTLTDEKCLTGEGRFLVAPPLRSNETRQKLIQGLNSGIIDCFATDHAPHTRTEKALGLQGAPPGMIGLETALTILWSLVKEKVITKSQLITKLTKAPREILGLPPNPIEESKVADFVIFKETNPYTLSNQDLHSKSQNSPFIGMEGFTKIQVVISKGKAAHVSGKSFQILH
jgi:dihydroorotase